MKKLIVCTLLSLITSSPLTHAGVHNKAGLFLGLGGSYNSVKFDQFLDASGVSNIYSDDVLVAYGQAGGPANPFHNTTSTFAPLGQVGYFGYFPDCTWMWGAKLSYKYVGLTVIDKAIDSPQYGSFTNTDAAPSDTTFTGNVLIQESQLRLKHEFDLLAFIGHSFKHSLIYLGVGPALFDTKADLLHSIGYADLNGVHYNITGTPTSFYNSKWVWGGAAQVGLTHYFDPTWFLDLNYTFAISSKFSFNDSAPFSSASAGYTDTGTLFASGSQRVTSQAVALTLNKLFSF